MTEPIPRLGDDYGESVPCARFVVAMLTRSPDWTGTDACPARIASASRTSGDAVGRPDSRRKPQNSTALMIASVGGVWYLKPLPGSRAPCWPLELVSQCKKLGVPDSRSACRLVEARDNPSELRSALVSRLRRLADRRSSVGVENGDLRSAEWQVPETLPQRVVDRE